jgi:four helix bundle protein
MEAGMARDHRKLRVFHDADAFVLAIYKNTKDFPPDERFGLRAQLRRAAFSIPTNIVEGSARRSHREYVNFLNVARGSASEAEYLLSLCGKLGHLSAETLVELKELSDKVTAQLQALINGLEKRGPVTG